MPKYINADRFERDCMFDRECEDMQDVIYKLRDYPSADVVEVKHGEWIKGREIAREMIADETLHIDYENFTCSNCGLVLKDLLYHIDGSPFYKFCPNCGADMRERKEAENDK